ncbi:hypothetical protein LIQ91_05265 [Ruminococcus callidus]|uniref:hypothetical protein n=1 Tax=Ruminococcus callidus TaxID=40519 RepID=UPI000ADBDCD5|nr:hypothetical protein [Ruminococcus callidus]MCB5775125.1 hypothetical protein [Ruminococcus callidus]
MTWARDNIRVSESEKPDGAQMKRHRTDAVCKIGGILTTFCGGRLPQKRKFPSGRQMLFPEMDGS